MIIGLFAAMALEASVSELAYTIIDDAEALRRARLCGASDLAFEFDELEQNTYLTVADPALSRDQLSCLAQAFDATNVNVLVPEQYRPAFFELAKALAEPRTRAFAVRELAKMGLGQPPVFDPSTTADEDFARVLENFCGPEATGALGSTWGPRTLSPGFMTIDDIGNEGKSRANWCLFLAGTLSGFEIGFIGNERLAAEPAPED